MQLKHSVSEGIKSRLQTGLWPTNNPSPLLQVILVAQHIICCLLHFCFPLRHPALIQVEIVCWLQECHGWNIACIVKINQECCKHETEHARDFLEPVSLPSELFFLQRIWLSHRTLSCLCTAVILLAICLVLMRFYGMKQFSEGEHQRHWRRR